MKHIEIEGTNAHPGAPANWDPKVDGTCGILPVRVTWAKNALGHDTGRAQTCESAWVPSPEELELLNLGGSVVLTVCGWQVPVSLHVDRPLPICILAADRIDADRWYRCSDAVHKVGKIQCHYAINAEAIKGLHFSKVIELDGFEKRDDAFALRQVAHSLVRRLP